MDPALYGLCKYLSNQPIIIRPSLRPDSLWACLSRWACLLSHAISRNIASTIDPRFAVDLFLSLYTTMDIPGVRPILTKELVSLVIRSPSVSAGGAGGSSDPGIFGTSPSSRQPLGSPAFRQHRWEDGGRNPRSRVPAWTACPPDSRKDPSLSRLSAGWSEHQPVCSGWVEAQSRRRAPLYSDSIRCCMHGRA